MASEEEQQERRVSDSSMRRNFVVLLGLCAAVGSCVVCVMHLRCRGACHGGLCCCDWLRGHACNTATLRSIRTQFSVDSFARIHTHGTLAPGSGISPVTTQTPPQNVHYTLGGQQAVPSSPGTVIAEDTEGPSATGTTVAAATTTDLPEKQQRRKTRNNATAAGAGPRKQQRQQQLTLRQKQQKQRVVVGTTALSGRAKTRTTATAQKKMSGVIPGGDVWMNRVFYRCMHGGEAYGAAWLAGKQGVLNRRLKVEEGTHMEVAGVFDPSPTYWPLKSVNMFDFSVEHLSWLERRVGLRDLTGKIGKTLNGEFIRHMSLREHKFRALYQHYHGESTAPPPPPPPPPPRRPSVQPVEEVVAIMPYFATRLFCNESDVGGGRCDSGSSNPEMRGYFLNLTVWSVHALTRHIVVSCCTEEDARFIREQSGLPIFEVLVSDCHIYSSFRQAVIFKPGLLGVLTFIRLQEKLRSDPRWAQFQYVYYTEADQVLHTSNPRALLRGVTPKTFLAPHRLMPISDPADLPTLGIRGTVKQHLARWVPEDLVRLDHVYRYNRMFYHQPRLPELQVRRDDPQKMEAYKRYVCCFDGYRGCPRDRSYWKQWKRIKPNMLAADPTLLNISSFKTSDSLTMLAGSPDFGEMAFRTCDFKEIRVDDVSADPSVLLDGEYC